MLTKAQKKYLYAVYKMGQSKGKMRLAEVAGIVGVSKPSAVKMMQKLMEDGYITKEPYREIALTQKGVREANELYTPSVIIYDFLKNTIGISDENADKDAVIMVSQISDESLEGIVNFALEYKE